MADLVHERELTMHKEIQGFMLGDVSGCHTEVVITRKLCCSKTSCQVALEGVLTPTCYKVLWPVDKL